MVFIAVVAEGLPAALRPAVGTNQDSTIGAFSDSELAAANAIRIVGKFNLAALHSPAPHSLWPTKMGAAVGTITTEYCNRMRPNFYFGEEISFLVRR